MSKESLSLRCKSRVSEKINNGFISQVRNMVSLISLKRLMKVLKIQQNFNICTQFYFLWKRKSLEVPSSFGIIISV